MPQSAGGLQNQSTVARRQLRWQHNKVATALVDAVDSLSVSPGAEVVRVASLYETANSQPCHKAVSKTSRKMKALEKLQLGV